jgi:hypothetical protein
MRTKAQFITFGAFVPDAASGGMVLAVPDVPIKVTRTGVGVYQLNFDPRILIIGYGTVADNVQRVTSNNGPIAPGQITVARWLSTTGAVESGGFYFTATAKDGRT